MQQVVSWLFFFYVQVPLEGNEGKRAIDIKFERGREKEREINNSEDRYHRYLLLDPSLWTLKYLHFSAGTRYQVGYCQAAREVSTDAPTASYPWGGKEKAITTYTLDQKYTASRLNCVVV